jgi:hypothetical protein
MTTFLMRVPKFLPGGVHGVGHLVEVGNVAVRHRILGQGLDHIALHPQPALACVGQLHQLDRGRADVGPDDGQPLGGQQVQIHIQVQEFSFTLLWVGAFSYFSF